MGVAAWNVDDVAMTTSRKIRHAAVLIPILALGLTACGAAQEAVSERLVEEAVGGDVDLEFDEDGQVASIETEDGSLEIVSGGEVPDEWPADVPTFDGGELVTSYAATSDGQTVVSVDYITDSDANEVMAGLTTAYESAGFTTTSESTMGDGSGGLLSYVGERDGTTMTASVTYGEGSDTMVILGVIFPAG